MANSENVVVRYADLSNMSNSLNALSRNVQQVGNNIGIVNKNIGIVDNKINRTANELADLKKQFVLMIEEQRKNAALQRALTEIIRVRQELDQKFGNHQFARDTMLGILQANDLALVSKETFKRCSEELMIATPKYWLAPCVVALTAWISNDKDLAYRALNEGIRRDAEKTTLLFALICRRVAQGYADTKKKDSAQKQKEAQKAAIDWLKMHMQLLQAHDMKRSVITLLDAYINKVFSDTDDDADVYGNIERWLLQIESDYSYWPADQKGGSASEYKEACRAKGAAQREKEFKRWANVMSVWCKSTAEQYPTLAKTCPEFGKIDAYLQRVNAVGGIYNYFNQILTAKIDRKELMDAIDEQLINLVTMYDDEERDLRLEEERMQRIKEFKGDEERADRVMKLLHGKKDEHVNFIDCLTQEVVGITGFGASDISTDTAEAQNSRASVRKCAVIILHDYIVGGYEKFITECAGDFPTLITIELKEENWKGQTDGVNNESIHTSFKTTMEERRTKRQSEVKCGKRTLFAVLMAVAAFVAIIGAFATVAVAVIGAIAAIVCLVCFCKQVGRIKRERAAINADIDARIKNGEAVIDAAINEWCTITAKVAAFKKKEETRDPSCCVSTMIPMLKGADIHD